MDIWIHVLANQIRIRTQFSKNLVNTESILEFQSNILI